MALNIPWNLLKKFVQGDINEIDLKNIDIWRNSSELNRYIFNEVIADQDFKQGLINGQWDNNSGDWEKILSKIKPGGKTFRFSRKTFYFIGSISAAVFLLLGISFGILCEKIGRNDFRFNEGYSYIYSPRGQRTQIILPDHTKVWLNSESSVRYASSFNQQVREVYLEGEGYFEVKKNPRKPFLVNANEIKVKVYGTCFNLKAFPDDNYIETTLIEGKLSVIPTNLKGKSGEEIFLEPNEKCIYEKTRHNTGKKNNTKTTIVDKDLAVNSLKQPLQEVPNIILAKNTDTEPEKLWKEGKLVFKNETFGELEIKLERWFDINIHFEDAKIRNYRFTGVFDKETINQAMEALKISSQQSYRYDMIYRDIYLK